MVGNIHSSVQHDIHGLIDRMTEFDKTQNRAERGDLFAARLDEYWSTYQIATW